MKLLYHVNGKASATEMGGHDDIWHKKPTETTPPAADAAPKPNKWQKFVSEHQRGVGIAEAGAGAAATFAAHGKLQEINNRLDMKLSNGENVTIGDRVAQGTYGLTTAVAGVATLDGLSRAATKQGLGSHVQRLADTIKSSGVSR